MKEIEAIRTELTLLRKQLHDDGIIQHALQHVARIIPLFINYMEKKTHGQEDTQSNTQDEEGREGHREGEAEGSNTSAKKYVEAKRKAKEGRPRRA